MVKLINEIRAEKLERAKLDKKQKKEDAVFQRRGQRVLAELQRVLKKRGVVPAYEPPEEAEVDWRAVVPEDDETDEEVDGEESVGVEEELDALYKQLNEQAGELGKLQRYAEKLEKKKESQVGATWTPQF